MERKLVEQPTGICGRVATFAYDSLGVLTQLAAPGSQTLGFQYDGTLLKQQSWSGPTTGTVTFAYDTSFRVTSIGAGTSTSAYAYDADDLLLRAGALTFTRRSDNGLLSTDSLGVVKGTWTFDGHAALGRYQVAASSTALYDVQYARDSLGRVTTQTETVQGTTLVRAFTYDSAGRLWQTREGGTLVREYRYDANGNRTSLTGPGLSLTGTTDAQDRLLSYGARTYTYDRAGTRLTQVSGTDTTRTTYDALGNLRSIKVGTGPLLEYVIDGQNRRVARKANGVVTTRWLYQGQLSPVAEVDSVGTVITRYVYGTRSNVPDYMVRGGVTYRFVLDQLGSVRLVVNSASGAVVQRLDYDEWGQVTANTNAGFQPFGYAGGLTDAGTPLVRFGARDYDPYAGRWTAKDPIDFGGKSNNLFVYAANAPTSYVDPTGQFIVGVYDQRTGILTLWDVDKGTVVWGSFNSGGRPWGDPLPNGTYDIVERIGRDDFYRLEPADSPYRDDTDQRTGRTNFRLHKPGLTLGCIAANNQPTWDAIKAFIDATSTDMVDVLNKSRLPWAPRYENATRYGRLYVTNSY